MTDAHPRARRLPPWLARLGIRGRLTALVVVATLATAAVGVTGLLAVRAALDQVHLAVREGDAVTRANDAARSAQVHFKKQVQEWKNVLLRGFDPAMFARYLKGFNDEEAAVRADLQRLRGMGGVADGEVRVHIDSLLAVHGALGVRYRQALEGYDGADPQAHRRVDAAVRGIDRAPTDAMDSLVARIQRAGEARLAEVDRRSRAVMWRMLAGIGALLLAGSVLALWLASRIVDGIARPLRRLTVMAERVAAGDLRHALAAEGDDEVARLGRAFDRMTAELRGVIGPLGETSARLGAASGDLAGIAGQTGGAARELKEVVGQIAAGASDQAQAAQRTVTVIAGLSHGVRQVAADAEAIQRDAETMRDTALRGGSIVRGAVDGMLEIRQAALSGAGQVEGLSVQSRQIGDFVRVISEIAEQTNLLALNAAIEAARAGDQGRGFAVVADEVRKLAARSSDSAARTAELVGGMRASIDEAVAAMRARTEAVQQRTEMAREAGDALGSIMQAVERAHQQVRGVAGQARRMAAEIPAVAGMVDAVAVTAEQNAASAGQMAAMSDQVLGAVQRISAIAGANGHAGDAASLAGSARHMEALVGRFQV
jgi:methyl-accepting chemotaxis protein